MERNTKSKNSESDRMERSLEVRLSPQEKEGFRMAAEIAGISLSDWVRERLRRVARQELEQAGHPIPFIRPPKME
jgi:uncharacterized protein (DUF1778 family)